MTRSTPVFVLLVLLAVACGESDVVADIPTELPPYNAAECSVDTAAPSIRAEAWVTGAVNNIVRVDGDVAWVVHSGDNTIGRLSLDSGRFEADFVDVGNDRNPWDALGANGRLYVSNFLSGSVTIADRDTGVVLGEVVVDELVSPAGVAANATQLFVASSGFVGPEYAPPAVVVFDVLEQAPWLEPSQVLEPRGHNTLYVHWDDDRDTLYAVSGGETDFDSDGEILVRSDAVIDRFVGEGLDWAGSLVLERAPEDLKSGGPSDLLRAGSVAYLPSRVARHIYKVDLDAWVVLRGPKDPIIAYEGEGSQLTSMVLAGDGRAYVTAFNQDSLYVFDTSCDATVAGPFNLGRSDFLEGPIGIDYDPVRRRGFVLLSVSNGMSEFLDPQ